MEFSPRAAELTTLLESRITNFYTNFQVDEIGRVVSVGDGIARVYGLNEIQAGEMVEFASGVKGIALNLENENVGIVVFGSDTAITGGNLLFFAFLLLGLTLLFRLSSLRLKKKYGSKLVLFLYISILFFISLFCFFLRLYLFSKFCLHFHLLFFMILSFGGGELTLPDPSGPSSSSSWREDSFEMAVLLEPFSETEIEGGTPVNSSIPEVARDEAEPSHQPHIVLNASLESSIQNRIFNLEKDETLFLLGKERGLYWKEIRESLHQAPSQGEYNRLLEFENRDLQIRERKHSCYSLFQEVLYEDEGLAARAPYNPGEALIYFFFESRDALDTHTEWDTAERDRQELKFLDELEKDLRERGPDSLYIKKIFGL